MMIFAKCHFEGMFYVKPMSNKIEILLKTGELYSVLNKIILLQIKILFRFSQFLIMLNIVII